MQDYFVNPLIYTVLGPVARSEDFPTEQRVMELYVTLHNLPAEDIVMVAVSDPKFSAYIDLIKTAIVGMDVSSIGKVLVSFIDKYFPELMKKINTDEADFVLFKAVVAGLVAEIRKGE